MQRHLIRSFVYVRLSTCFDYSYNTWRVKRLRRNHGVYLIFLIFNIYLFICHKWKLSCFEVSCIFSLWALIGEYWHNWSIILVIYRDISNLDEKHRSMPGIWISMWQSIKEAPGGTWIKLSCSSLIRWCLLWHKDYVLICVYISFCRLM